MRPFHVALIGYGLAGRVFHAPLIEAVDGLKLAAVVSSRCEEIAKAYPGVRVLAAPEEVFQDPCIDVVVVATPNDSHFDLASRALKAGKHVVIDKPVACTAAEARALIAQSTGRILTVFQNRRWDGDFLTLKRLMADGTLGDIVYVESHFDRFRPEVRDRWRERAGIATGIWYDLGSHLLDQALQLLGRPLAVAADLAARRDGALSTDYFRVLLRYEKLRVVLVGDCRAPADERRFVVHGSRASFLKDGLDPQEAFLAAGGTPLHADYGVDPQPGRVILPGGREQAVPPIRGDYPAFYEGLRDALRTVAPLPVTVRQALEVMEILEAAEVSAARRCEIALTT
jgi:predicted dehydrogenase